MGTLLYNHSDQSIHNTPSNFSQILTLYFLEVDLRKLLSRNNQLRQILYDWFCEHFPDTR
jgi:hypothetical protein